MVDLPTDLPLLDFAIALFIGALVGIEREKKQAEAHERGVGGLRTFVLFAEAGAVAAWLAARLEAPAIFVGTGVLVSAIVIAGYAVHAPATRSYGLTTEIAAVVVFLLGGAAVSGERGIAVALAIATSAVLAFKEPMHGAVDRLGRSDILAALKLGIASFIILPVLPDRPLDPWDALNPHRIWLLVVLISGLSLVGYAATRWLGAGRGIPLTGLFGGLVSSTAVTLSFARRSREDGDAPGLASALAAGILLAWATMFGRVLIAVAAVHAPLLGRLALPMGALGGLAAGAAWLEYRRGAAGAGKDDVPLRNPFSLASAIRFAALFAVVLLGVKIAEAYLPPAGIYAVAALAGVTDVDAITLSMADLARGGGDAGRAATAIVIAALVNTAVKCGLVAALGTAALRNRVGLAAAVLAAAAAGALALG